MVVVVVLGTVVTVGVPGVLALFCSFLSAARSSVSCLNLASWAACSASDNSGRPSFSLKKLLGLSLTNWLISACFSAIFGCIASLAALGVLRPAVWVVWPPPLTVSVLVVV